jgi:hypothetical protein
VVLDTSAGVQRTHVSSAQKKLVDEPEIRGESDNDVPDDGEPADNPRYERRNLGWGKHEAPVIHASSDGIARRDLPEGHGDADGDERHDDPSPERDHGAAVHERVV